ncbi:substrate-binding periplasmic protein [Spartinivicinus marinus]|uniref:substrate-binding periplasmic protein n=1 Tax=Spartinivicinus marinus TaxID=2994442 RepID=UPI0022543D91|nr:ABC transporter substrate-binding protein [Spartinivicinus marinus]
MNHKIEIQLHPILRMFKNLKNHSTHAAFGMSYRAERAKKWYYSYPINYINYSLYVNKTNPLKYSKREQLEGYTVATWGPTNMSKTLSGFAELIPNLTIKIFPEYKNVYKMLDNGRFGEKGAIYAPDSNAELSIRKELLSNIRFAGVDKKNIYYIVFVKDTTPKSYIYKFNEAILNLYKNGRMSEIYNSFSKQGIIAKVPLKNDFRILSQ